MTTSSTAETREKIHAIRQSLSPARMSTYEAAAPPRDDTDSAAINLYIWNFQISGAFMAPLHICEVVVRNAISEAIEAKYGPSWPWSRGFEQSLPSLAKKELSKERNNKNTTGKVIPELKLVFWEKMLTSRHDDRIWKPCLAQVFPEVDSTKAVSSLRYEISQDLQEIRGLRNRIAHHEPIFKRNLTDDFNRIARLIACRCSDTEQWMKEHQEVKNLLAQKP